MAELKKNFSLKFGHSIHHKLVSIGKYDGIHPCLTCGTTAGKVFVHNPYEKNDGGNDDNRVTFLNINQNVSTLVAGKLQSSSTNDVLFIGTPTNLLAYDVMNNEDIYYREIADGVRKMIIGKIGHNNQHLAIIGGNCSIIGLDENGSEAFWTVCGDNIGAMTLIKNNKIDKSLEMSRHSLSTTSTSLSSSSPPTSPHFSSRITRNHLFVGSDDYGLRKYENEEQIWECFESNAFVGIESLIIDENTSTNISDISKKSSSSSSSSNIPCFSYALSNGTVGVYDMNQKRIWRVKSKHECRALVNWDSTGNGVLDVVTGWSNGSVVIRKAENGQVLFKQPGSSHPIAGLVCADYRMEGGALQLIVCNEAGEVDGYMANSDTLPASQHHEELVSKLQASKTSLMHELSAIRETLKVEATEEDNGKISLVQENNGLQIHISFRNYMISQVIIFDLEAGLFKDSEGMVSETLLVSCSAPYNNHIIIPIFPQRNVVANLTIQVLAQPRASGSTSSNLNVFELKLTLPKFATLFLADKSFDNKFKPNSSVKFTLPGKLGGGKSSLIAITDWIDSKFMIENLSVYDMLHAHRQSPARPGRGGSGKLNAVFEYVNDDHSKKRSPLWIEAEYNNESELLVILSCEGLELASLLMSDLCTCLELKELSSIAEFDVEMTQLKQLIEQVSDLNEIRLRLTVGAVESVNRVKGLVVKAEDARLMGNISLLKRHYVALHGLNSELAMEYTKRSTNHEVLLDLLRQVNVFIERGSRLRVGSHRSAMVAQARAAIKANNAAQLITVIELGASANR